MERTKRQMENKQADRNRAVEQTGRHTNNNETQIEKKQIINKNTD